MRHEPIHPEPVTAGSHWWAAVLLLLLLTVPALAQPVADQPEMADALRQDGKFWVVVLTFGIVMAGMFIYLFRLEKKVQQLEGRVKK